MNKTKKRVKKAMFEFPKTTGCSPVAAVEKSYITPDILSRMEN
jgi:hypothetical protein